MTSVDRSQPPRIPPARPVPFPAFRKKRLESGVTLYAVEAKRTPLVIAQVLMPGGGHYDPVHRRGLAAFTADLLEEGTHEHSSTEIADLVESIGGSLTTGAGWNAASATVSLLSVHAERGLQLLIEVCSQPAFDAAEVERLRRERLADILRRLDQPATLARAAFSRAVYGDSVYGSLLVGGEGSIRALQREEIVRFFENHSAVADTFVLVVGDTTELELEDTLDATFARRSKTPPALPQIHPRQLDSREIVIVNRPDAAQTELCIGHASAPHNHSDRTILTVMNTLLGGKFTSRINLNLRERNGFTYGASTGFAPRLGPGPFVASTAVANDVAGAAAGEILAEIERLREEEASEEELSDTVSYLQGVFAYGLQTHAGVLHRLHSLAVFDLPDDYYDTYLAGLPAITTEEIQRVAQEHLCPDQSVIVAVGPVAELQPQLEGLGELSVVEPASLLL